MRKRLSKRKTWKLHGEIVQNAFSSYVNKQRESNQEYAPVEGKWNVLKGALLEATDQSCG